MKSISILTIALLLVSIVFGATSGVSAAGTKPTEPIYGHQYIQNTGAASYYIPFHGGSNISIDSSGWTCGVVVYTVNWNTVLYTKSFDDAALSGGSGKGFPGNDSHVWFVSAIDQMLTLMINMGGCKLDYTINMTNTTYQAPDLKPIYDLIEELNQSINSINTTVQGLTAQTGFLKANITGILAEIAVLKALIAADSINITALQTAIASLQGQLDSLKAEVSSINASVTNNINVTNNITQLADLTAINQSIEDLTTALDDLNATVRAIDIPPDMQGNVTKLQAENAQLRKDLDALKKTPPGSNVTLYNNETLYSNNTVNNTKQMTAAGAGAVGLGGVLGCVGLIGMTGATKKKRKVEEEEPEDIEVQEAVDKEYLKKHGVVVKSPLPEPVPVAKAEVVPEAPTRPIEKAKVIAIGMAEYTESDLMSKLTSLPRGLPPELSDKDISTLAYELMNAEYVEDEEGEVFVHLGKKWFFGNPEHSSTYMQKAKPPMVKKPLKAPSADTELDDILRKI